MSHSITLCVALVALGAAGTQELPAPVVEGVPLPPLRENVARLLRAAEKLNVEVPAPAVKSLHAWPGAAKSDTEAVESLQRLLDPHVLVRININPESRVKVALGPADAALTLGRDTYFLVKVHNEAGVTHELTVSGDQLREKGKESGRWLEAAVLHAPPMAKTLSGHHVEYVLLRLTARESGKREATLAFDVGQGTQDLGFRNEVPVLFTVAAK